MSLSSVLVDNARIVSYRTLMSVASPGSPSVPVVVEGETQMAWAPGPWFACRVDSPGAAEANDAPGARVRPDQSVTMIYELFDEDGGSVSLSADDRVEVDSEELGRATFEVTGVPTLDRKKRDLVCGEASLKRIVDSGPVGRPVPGRALVGIGASSGVGVSESDTAPLTVAPSGAGSVS